MTEGEADPHGRVHPSSLVTPGSGRGHPIQISLHGQQVTGFAGETVGALLTRLGQRAFRSTARFSAYRGIYCGMGVCYDCLVVADGIPNSRACMTYVAAGMSIWSQRGWDGARETEQISHSGLGGTAP